MNKSLFSAVIVSGLVLCSAFAAAASPAKPAAAGDAAVVTLPTITIVGKRDTAARVVTLPTVYIVAHRNADIQVASR